MVSDIRLCTCVSSCHSPPTSADTHEDVHPHTWKQFTSLIHISDLSLVRCFVPTSDEFVLERHRQHVVADRLLEPPPLVVASAELVAAMLSCFVQTLIRCLPCKIMHPTDRFPRLCVFCPIRVSKGVQGNCMSLPLKQTPNSWFSNKESAKSVRAFSSLVRPTETSLSTVSCWRTCCRASGDKQVSPRRDRTEHGDLLRPQLGVDAAFVVFDPGFSIGRYFCRGSRTCTFESQGIDHFFRMVRVFFDPKPSGTPPYRSVEGLKLLIQTCGVPDHLRLYLVLSRTFGSASQRLPWSP